MAVYARPASAPRSGPGGYGFAEPRALGLSATALVWANIASGHPPQIDATVYIVRVVLTADQAGGTGGGAVSGGDA